MEHQVQQVQQEVQAPLVQQEVQDHQVHLVQMETLAVSHLNINGQRVPLFLIQVLVNLN